MKKLSTFILLWMMTMPLHAEEMKNVIMMIGDGWGYNDIKATDYWLGHEAVYESFPVRLFMSTYSWTTLQNDPSGLGYDPSMAWASFGYMLLRPTDSASSATAMSTGRKIDDGMLNVDPLTYEPLFTVCQRAEQLGKSTGVITTVPFSHATPAGYLAHDEYRGNYAQIAIEMIDSSNAEVIMGAGHPYYNSNGQFISNPGAGAFQYVGGQTKWNQVVAGAAGGAIPWTLITTKAEFQNLATGPTPQRVIGVPRVSATLQKDRTPQESANAGNAPNTVPFNINIPTLAEMARAGLNVLDNNPNGFFLMIEGGAIDWASHSNQQGRMIEEMIDYNNAIEAVIQWVETHSSWEETIVIITGDHETGYLWGLNSGYPATFNPIVNNGAGVMPMMRYYSGDHSNSLIPIFVKGAGSSWFNLFADQIDPVRGAYIDNTEIANLIFGYYDQTLAVDLLNFTAISADHQIELNWTTASEENNSYFELSKNGGLLARIQSAGQSSSAQTYRFTDTQVENGAQYEYILDAIDEAGVRTKLAGLFATPRASSRTVSSYKLYQNYPNPLNPTTNIPFDLAESSHVSLKIYDLTGREAATVFEDEMDAGSHSISFDAKNLSSGIYIYRLKANNFSAEQKMVLIK